MAESTRENALLPISLTAMKLTFIFVSRVRNVREILKNKSSYKLERSIYKKLPINVIVFD